MFPIRVANWLEPMDSQHCMHPTPSRRTFKNHSRLSIVLSKLACLFQSGAGDAFVMRLVAKVRRPQPNSLPNRLW